MKSVAIIGAGPAGLMAAEKLAQAGMRVTLYERKASVARKFLLAGRGGLNLTHSEPIENFLTRYGDARIRLEPSIRAFPPEALRAWCEGLGQKTFVGSSGRVFPESFKASPLLRAWLGRLDALGVQFAMQRIWAGWDGQGALVFKQADGSVETVKADAVLLALGGASWPHLGADGSWVEILKARGVPVAKLRPANCGFTVNWSDVFRDKFEGVPLKGIGLSLDGETVQGEAMVTRAGIEGGAVYALSAAIRNKIEERGAAEVSINLRPQMSREALLKKLEMPRRRLSFSSYMQKTLALAPVAVGLLREADRQVQDLAAAKLADLIKAVPVRLDAPFGIGRAISSAGGIEWDGINDQFMLKALPGVFAAGEMLDWEAPTGGYLLQATFSTAGAAADGIERFLSGRG